MVSTLTEQLKEKDKQIERLQIELENAQKSIDQAQQLHAMTEQKIKLLEQKETTCRKETLVADAKKSVNASDCFPLYIYKGRNVSIQFFTFVS